MSSKGSTLPETWITSLSSKHLTTWTIASTSLIFDKNLFPKPSPLLAPFTNPAISTNSIFVGIIFWLELRSPSSCNLWSGTETIPLLGSIVQKGKLAAWA